MEHRHQNSRRGRCVTLLDYGERIGAPMARQPSNNRIHHNPIKNWGQVVTHLNTLVEDGRLQAGEAWAIKASQYISNGFYRYYIVDVA